MTRTLTIRHTPIILVMVALATLIITLPMHPANATDVPPFPPIDVNPDTTKVITPGGDSSDPLGPTLLDLILASLLALTTE